MANNNDNNNWLLEDLQGLFGADAPPAGGDDGGAGEGGGAAPRIEVVGFGVLPVRGGPAPNNMPGNMNMNWNDMMGMMMNENPNNDDIKYDYSLSPDDDITNPEKCAAASFLGQVRILASSKPELQQLLLAASGTPQMVAVAMEAMGLGDELENPSELLSEAQLEELGTAIKHGFPLLTNLKFGINNMIPDTHSASLLKCVPINLTSLTIGSATQPVSLFGGGGRGASIELADTFRQISAFKGLTELKLQFRSVSGSGSFLPGRDMPLSLESFKALACTLGVVDEDTQERRLPNLRKITIQGVLCPMDGTDHRWAPVIRAIRSNPNLETVDVSYLGQIQEGRPRPVAYSFDADTAQDLLFGPRIQEITKQYNLSETNVVLDDWISAMMACQDRFDIFHYFFSKIFPSSVVYDPEARRRQVLDETMNSIFAQLEAKIDDSVQKNSRAIVRLEGKLDSINMDELATKMAAQMERKMMENNELVMAKLAQKELAELKQAKAKAEQYVFAAGVWTPFCFIAGALTWWAATSYYNN